MCRGSGKRLRGNNQTLRRTTDKKSTRRYLSKGNDERVRPTSQAHQPSTTQTSVVPTTSWPRLEQLLGASHVNSMPSKGSIRRQVRFLARGTAYRPIRRAEWRVSEWMEDVTRVQVDQARDSATLEGTLNSCEPRQVESPVSACTDRENGQSGGYSGRPCGAEGQFLLSDCVHMGSVSGTGIWRVIGCDEIAKRLGGS